MDTEIKKVESEEKEHAALLGGGTTEAMAIGKREAKVTGTNFEAADFEDAETSEDSPTVVSNEVTRKTDEEEERESLLAMGGSNTFGSQPPVVSWSTKREKPGNNPSHKAPITVHNSVLS